MRRMIAKAENINLCRLKNELFLAEFDQSFQKTFGKFWQLWASNPVFLVRTSLLGINHYTEEARWDFNRLEREVTWVRKWHRIG